MKEEEKYNTKNFDLYRMIADYSRKCNEDRKQELGFMFLLADVIAEIQMVIVEAKLKNTPDEKLKKNIELMDNLMKIYKSFDSFYYQASIAAQKIIQVESVNLKMATEIMELRKENIKLLQTLKFNEEKS